MTAPPPHKWHLHLWPAALLAALTLWVAYPMSAGISTRIEDLGDPLLNAWILSWDHWALFHQLGDFFSANIFWPHSDALAYGEPMLAQALLTLPLRPIFDHPVALHNLSLIQAIFFSGLAAYALGFHYFRRIGPAAVCALAYGPAAYRVNQSVHIQLIHGEFLPLMILAIERVLAGGGRRWRVTLGAAALAQWLSSWYWAVFSFWVVVPYLLVRAWHFRKSPTAPSASLSDTHNTQLTTHNSFRIPHLILPFIVAAALAAPVAWPTLRLMKNGLMIRPEEQSAWFSAHPADYITPGRRSLLYAGLDLEHRLGGGGAERALFPGFFVALGFFAAMALAFRKSTIRHPQFPLSLWLGITLLMLAFTFGSQAVVQVRGSPHAIPLPLALLNWFPLAGQMRVPARWMLPALLGLALIAAWAWDQLRSGEGGIPKRNYIASAAFLFLIIETLTRPAAFTSLPDRPPEAVEWLNRQPWPAPVLFIPPAYPRMMLEAAWLHQPTLNGTNGYFPAIHRGIVKFLVSDFPQYDSIPKLRAIGTRFVVVNTTEAGQASAGWDPARNPALQAALPPSLKTERIGPYQVIDLGPPETDAARIAGQYHELELEVLKTRRRQ